MSEMENTPKKRGRPPRQAEEQQTRRRRKQSGGETLNLAVNEDMLDKERFKYRFINDDGVRLEQFTQHDDWDIVYDSSRQVKEDGDEMGAAVSRIVGSRKDGSPMKAYLCRKPREFWEEDQAAKQKELDETMTAVKRGPLPGSEGLGGSERDHSYVPSSGISIKEGGRK